TPGDPLVAQAMGTLALAGSFQEFPWCFVPLQQAVHECEVMLVDRWTEHQRIAPGTPIDAGTFWVLCALVSVEGLQLPVDHRLLADVRETLEREERGPLPASVQTGTAGELAAAVRMVAAENLFHEPGIWPRHTWPAERLFAEARRLNVVSRFGASHDRF